MSVSKTFTLLILFCKMKQCCPGSLFVFTVVFNRGSGYGVIPRPYQIVSLQSSGNSFGNRFSRKRRISDPLFTLLTKAVVSSSEFQQGQNQNKSTRLYDDSFVVHLKSDLAECNKTSDAGSRYCCGRVGRGTKPPSTPIHNPTPFKHTVF